MGKETIHFEAPPAERVDQEMGDFLDWLNNETILDLVLKAALAHLWFVTIHPFDDGNGRIGRAIADLILARSEKSSHRFYSLSAQIQRERKNYYTILEKTQKGGLDITPWIEWFFGCLGRAIEDALSTLQTVVQKGHFWEVLAKKSLNERQRKIINLLLDGFKGKLTTSKWAKIAKCSQDTAYRDILNLIDQGILIKNSEGGRSTSYSLVLKTE
jgi:Fic family protein